MIRTKIRPYPSSSGGAGRCVYEDGASKGHCVGGNGKSPCTGDADCNSGSVPTVDPKTNDTLFTLPNGPKKDTDACDGYKLLSELLSDKTSSLPFYAEWANFHDNFTDPESQSFIRLLWSATLSYVKGTSSDTIYGVNSILSNKSGALVDHFYVTKDQNDPNNPVGVISSNSEDIVNQIKDPTLLQITLLEEVAYTPLNGMPQASCNENATAISGQGYTATAQKIGYCRDKFINRYTLWSLGRRIDFLGVDAAHFHHFEMVYQQRNQRKVSCSCQRTGSYHNTADPGCAKQ